MIPGMPVRACYVWVCTNRREDGNPKGSCAQKGSEKLRDDLKKCVAAAGLARTVRVSSSGCMDLCEYGTAVAVEPEHALLGEVTTEDLPSLIAGLQTHGGVSQHPGLRARRLDTERDPGGTP